MSVHIYIEKKGYRIYKVSVKRIHKHDTRKVTWYNVLDSVPSLELSLAEARKIAKNWFGHSGENKESVIDLHVKGCTKKQNGKFFYENEKFYRYP